MSRVIYITFYNKSNDRFIAMFRDCEVNLHATQDAKSLAKTYELAVKIRYPNIKTYYTIEKVTK